LEKFKALGAIVIVGLSINAFTTLHVIISLIAIATSFVVMFGMLRSNKLPGWTAVCLLFTVLTTVTGFMFPFNGFTPAIGTGVVSAVLLAFALAGLYVMKLAGSWRWIYVVTAVAAFWFNVFVLIVQSFEKLKFLNPAAPMVGPPFAEPANTYFIVAQAAALLFFVVMGFLAARKFRPGFPLGL
jgi:hypothetical protein